MVSETVESVTGRGHVAEENVEGDRESKFESVFLPPYSSSFQSLLGVDGDTLAAEQAGDSTLRNLGGSEKEGIARRNVSLQTTSGPIYRRYKDRRGVVYDQLVVPTKSYYEQEKDWEACLPAALFALCTVPHESRGHRPSLRSRFPMLREAWEGHGDDVTVGAYVSELLDRMHSTRELVETNMKAAQRRARLYYNRTTRQRPFAWVVR